MISRLTLFSFLLALLLGVGIRLWYIQQRDECARYLAGDLSFPSSQVVVSGTRTIVVPCNQWLMRMPSRVQLLCLGDIVLVVIFLLSWVGDIKRWFETRARRRGAV